MDEERMIILRQKEFGWWRDLNTRMAIKCAKQGQKWNPSWSKYISEEEYNKYLPSYMQSSLKKKSPEEEEEDYIVDLSEDYPKLARDLSGILKLHRDKSINNKYPDFGDGDEYPTFYITNTRDERDDFIPVVCFHCQLGCVGINPSRGFWCYEDKPNTPINLKKYLLDEYNTQLRYYIEAEKTDGIGWDDDQYDQVIKWIEALIGGVKKYL